eukprot:1737610-Prorocentrum_lima.AAC.1
MGGRMTTSDKTLSSVTYTLLASPANTWRNCPTTGNRDALAGRAAQRPQRLASRSPPAATA